MIELLLLRTEARLDIAKTPSVRDLGKSHAQKMIKAEKLPYSALALVFSYSPAKDWQRHELHNLLENQLSGKMCIPPLQGFAEEFP